MNATLYQENSVVTTVLGCAYKVQPGSPGADITVTDDASGVSLDLVGGVFVAIGESVTVSAPCYIVPFDGAPTLGGGGGGSVSGSTLVVDYMPDLPDTASPGDLAFIKDGQELRIWNGSEWVPTTTQALDTVCNITITDKNSIECGYGASTNGSGGCISIGYNAQTKEATGNIYNTGKAPSWNTGDFSSVAYGANTSASYRGVAIGGNAKAGNPGSSNYRSNTAIGFNAKAGVSADGATASGSYATASGSSATASGSSATASGSSATASGSYATASGSYATASGYASTAIGANCVNGDDGTTAILAGFDAPTPENNYAGKIYQMWFFVKDGKPHVGFAKLNRDIEECSTDMDIDESYAIDLSQLPHVQWEPNTEIDASGCGGGC